MGQAFLPASRRSRDLLDAARRGRQECLPHDHPGRVPDGRRAFAILDAVIGLMILGALAAALLVALNRQRAAADRLAAARGATWAAEQALVELQSGHKPAGNGVQVEAVGTQASPPAGYAWVRVRAEHNGRSATLIGLVPAGMGPPSAAPADGEGGVE